MSVAYGDGAFVAVSWPVSDPMATVVTDTKFAMSSIDGGITWKVGQQSSASESSNLNHGWTSVAYGKGIFVAVSQTGSIRTMRSTDGGTTWRGNPSSNDGKYWNSVAYGNGVFVAVGALHSGTMRSTDGGITWSSGTPSSRDEMFWFSVAHGNKVFVAIASKASRGGATTGGVTMSSTDDGVTWTGRPSSDDTKNGWNSVAYGKGVFVAVGSDGINRTMTHPDIF